MFTESENRKRTMKLANLDDDETSSTEVDVDHPVKGEGSDGVNGLENLFDKYQQELSSALEFMDLERDQARVVEDDDDDDGCFDEMERLMESSMRRGSSEFGDKRLSARCCVLRTEWSLRKRPLLGCVAIWADRIWISWLAGAEACC